MIDRAELLRTVVENPDDDAPRLAFADWLDAHAHTLTGADRESANARAAYIRATVARARIPIVTRPADPWASSGGFWSGDISTWAEQHASSPFSGDPAAVERQRLWDAAYPLEKQYGERWVDDDIPPTYTERPRELERGFVERLRISPRLLAQSPALFLDAAPLRGLTFEWNHRFGFNTAADAVAVAALPQLRRIRDIDFFAAGDEFVTSFVRAFVVSPQAASLRTLDMAQPGKPVHGRDEALLAVAGSEYLAGLHTLNLSRNVLSPDALESLGSTGTLPSLRLLILDGCELNAGRAAALFCGGLLDRLDGMSLGNDPALNGEAVRVLVSRPGFSRFRMLHLGRCPVGDAGCRAVSESKHVTGLEAIALARAGVSGEGIAALLSSERLPALTTLMLPRSDLDAAAVAAFTASAPVTPLARLDLSYSPIGDAGVGLLAQSALISGLTHLRCNECGIGDAGAVVLAAANVASLQQLDLGRNRITDDGAAALARSPQLAKLERLNVSFNNLTDTGALALAELPGLKPYGLTLHGNGVSKRAEKKIEAVMEARRESR